MTQTTKNGAFAFSRVFALSEDTLVLSIIGVWTAISVYVTLKNPTVWLSDMFGFIPRAEALSLHSLSNWVDGLYPFGYPLLLKTLFWLTQDYEVAGRIISLVSGVVGLYLVYKLGTLTFDRKVGAMAVVFSSVNPTYLKYATVSGTDMVAMVIMLAAVTALAVYPGRNDKKWLLASGVLVGMAYLLRYTALLLVPCLIMWLLVRPRASATWKDRLPDALTFLGAFLLAASPQLVLSALEAHDPFYNQQASNVYFGMFGHWNWGLNWPVALTFRSMSQIILAYPKQFVRNWASNFVAFLQMDLAQSPLYLFVFPAMFFAFKKELRAERAALLILAYFSYGVAMAMAFLEQRLLLLCIPIALIFAAYGLYQFVPDALPTRGIIWRYARWGALLLLLLVMFDVYVRPLLPVDGYDRVKMQVSNTLNQSGMTSSQEVLSFSFDYDNLNSPLKERFAIVSWYNTGFIPYRSVDDIVARMTTDGERFLVFDDQAPKNVKGLAQIWPLDQRALERRFVLLGAFSHGAEVWRLRAEPALPDALGRGQR